jgi:hypothetical protein
MDIDEAGGDDQAVGIDLASRGARDIADRSDFAILDRDFAPTQCRAGAVADKRVPDQQIVWHVQFLTSDCTRFARLRTSQSTPLRSV